MWALKLPLTFFLNFLGKDGYSGDGSHGNCTDNCKDFCRNEGICLKVSLKLCTYVNFFDRSKILVCNT